MEAGPVSLAAALLESDRAYFEAGAEVRDVPGAAVALLYAPKTGQETRELLGEKAREGRERAAEAAAKLDGVAKVLVADAPHLANGLAEEVAATVVSLSGPYDAILAPATASGKNVLPRVAALLDVMQISDITKVLSPDTFERPIYAGNALQTVQSGEAKKVITVRTAAFAAQGEGGSAAIESVPAAAAGP